MRRFCAAIALTSALLGAPAMAASKGELEIRAWLQQWDRAFAAKDLRAVMSLYAPGPELVAYDLVPPLQYRGAEAYRKDYQEFFDQYAGPLSVEERDVHVAASGALGYAYGLERMAGTLKSGEKTEVWTRFTTVLRKVHGRWYAVHDHVSVPSDFATGKALLDLKP